LFKFMLFSNLNSFVLLSLKKKNNLRMLIKTNTKQAYKTFLYFQVSLYLIRKGKLLTKLTLFS